MTQDPARAEEAFRRLEDRLRRIPADQVQVPRVNPQRAAIAALSVAEYLSRAEVRERFARLSRAGEFDPTLLDDLPETAQAAWYAKHKSDLVSAASVEVQVPLAVFQEAAAVRSRMLKVLDYHRGDDPEVAARLAAIRGGRGHHDLSNDLLSLGELYRQHRAALAEDHRYYRSTDEEDAGRVARKILQLLSAGGTPEIELWTDMVARTWSLLHQTYEEVRRAGQFLFYHEDPEAKFPSLFGAARSARGAERL